MKQTTPGANIKGLARIQAGCVPSGMLTDSGEKRKEYPRTPLKLDGKGGWWRGEGESRSHAFLRSEVRLQKISVSCSRCLALLVESFAKHYQVPDFDLRYNSILSGVNRSIELKSVGKANKKKSSRDEITQFPPLLSQRHEEGDENGDGVTR